MQKKYNNKELLEYVRYLNRIRSRNSVPKKLYYFFLYYVAIPVLKIALFILRPFAKSPEPHKTDILVLGTCRNDIESSALVWQKLREKGYKVETIFTKSKTDLIKTTFASRPCLGMHPMLFLYASYARYLVKRYQPKIFCLYDSYDALPTFVRREMAPYGKTIYMPHAVIPTTYLFTSLDYDYYFVFGESSVQNLNNQKLTFGSTQIIKTGSPRLLPDYDRPPARPGNNFLYFSNWMVGKKEAYTRDFEIVREWAALHPEYHLYVKLHPVENNAYVAGRCAGIDNITILPHHTGMKDAVEKACLVISGFSSAMVEAALMHRPGVIVNARPYDENSEDVYVSDKLLYLEKFFTPRAQNPEQLQQRIEQTLQNYSHYISRCEEFVKFHYEYTLDAPERIASTIDDIIQHKYRF